MNAPGLRFKEFNNKTWTDINLSDFFDFIDGDRGKNYPSEEEFHDSGHCLFLNANNLTETGFSFKNTNWITEEKHNLLRKGIIEYGDLILTSRGSRLGKMALYEKNIPYEVARINSAMLIVRAKKNIDINYALYLFKDSILPNFIASKKVGSAQPHITVKDLKSVNTYIPFEITEQNKISNFLGLFNKKIQLQQEKIDLLKEQKKGYMQKIFNHELRFKDENGQAYPDWKKEYLDNLCDINTGNKDTQNKIENGKYPFFVRSQIVEKINTYSYDGEAILTAGDGVGVGKVFHYINGKFDFHQRVYMLSNFKNCIGKFIYYYFSSNFMKESQKYNAKTSVDSVRREMLTKMVFPYPSVEEQRKIADFLSQLDCKITLEEQTLTTLQNQKQAFRQQMFI